MKAIIHVREPESAEVTLTLTLTLAAWMKIREQLVEQWPSWDLAVVIDDAVRKLSERIVVDSERR